MLRSVQIGVLVVCAVYGAQLNLDEGTLVSDLSDGDYLTDLGESQMSKEGMVSFLGQPEISLGEIQAIADGSRMLDEAGVKAFKGKFIKLAEKINSQDLKQSALMLAQTSSSSLLRSNNKRKGLQLIFSKLEDLEKKVEQEGKDDTAYIMEEREKCAKSIKAASEIITASNDKIKANDIQIRTDHDLITRSRDSHKQSRISESSVQNEFKSMAEERTDTQAAFKQRIDERNKAIDVMVKATFIVCEKFRKFKDTDQCKSIKSRPDVNVPGEKVFPPSPSESMPPPWRNESLIDADKQATKAYEDSQAEAWAALQEQDEALQGSPNPENLPMHEPSPKASMSHEEVELAEDDEVPSEVASNEKPGLRMLSSLAKHANRERISPRYAMPITELAIAMSAGKTRKAKNIVQILLDVKEITVEEQRKDKEDLVVQLDSFYKRAWELRSAMSAESTKQEELLNTMEAASGRMEQMLQDTEEQRQQMNSQLEVRTLDEDRCAKENEEFGMRQAVRVEDLENLVKLTSLLRSLYDKVEPTACPLAENKIMCTNKDNGWCVFTDKETNEQRCSCNHGYYGTACEKVMCPGEGQDLYMAKNADGGRNDGVCSNHGDCDSDTGMCTTCDDGFYHGEKKACELKHCPPSKDGTVDEKCSGHGSCDTIRGICSCEEGFSGPGCENQSCPNSNGVLYAYTSGNACNGRGACDVDSGKCACTQPYYGDSCEKSKCPDDCLGLGGCNAQTGKCACPEGRHGTSCEFYTCPKDCNGPSSGGCNRLTGKCVCKMGYIGDSCEISTRCSQPQNSVKEQNWYTVWDKPGWVTCPQGQLLSGLRRSVCESLACLEAGRCAAPCEGIGENEKPLEVRHCYHSLDWYGSFDKEGWSKCDPNYYVSGLYRSCDSLYCLQMAKCCSYKESRWAECQEVNWFAPFNGPGWVKVPDHQFISGFYRGDGHTLKDIDKAWSCGLVQGY
jgi:hypothetical protein